MNRSWVRKRVMVFWLLVLTDLLAILLHIDWLVYIVKPLLMPMLAVLLVPVAGAGKKLLLAGLFFSWLGDVFLLFDSFKAIFFITGLASFFLTHTCYILYFLLRRNTAKVRPLPLVFSTLAIIAYGVLLVWILFPYLGALKLPVICYALVICGMLIASLYTSPKPLTPANQQFIIGATLFVLSDSILAINKFYHPVPLAGIAIMLTYCAAQYAIVSGFITTQTSVER